MSKRKPLPSQEYLKLILDYDEESGILTWKKRPLDHFKSLRGCNVWNARYAGTQAGCVRTLGSGYKYMRLSINDNHLRYHRVIWKWKYNEEPGSIDHIDGNATNNRLSNLRVSDPAANSINAAMNRRNKSGIAGVCFLEDKKAWLAQIHIDRKNTVLLYTKDFFEACCARRSAENDLGYSKRHGRKKAWYHEEAS